ncbi:MAG TPA: hypothetical protein VIU93_01910 [Gallionellaceae bacterium]
MMKCFGILLILFCSCHVQAEPLYSSVDEYVEANTIEDKNNPRNANGQHIEQHYNRAVSPNGKWHAGYEPNGTSESAFLYLLEKDSLGKFKLVSRNNTNKDWKAPYLFEDLAFDANDKFHVSIQIVLSGNAGHTYFFQLINGKWFLVKDNYSVLGPCGKGDSAEMFYSTEMSTNYLTGEIEEQRYSKEDCKPLQKIKKKHSLSVVPLSDFYPFMEIE